MSTRPILNGHEQKVHFNPEFSWAFERRNLTEASPPNDVLVYLLSSGSNCSSARNRVISGSVVAIVWASLQ